MWHHLSQWTFYWFWRAGSPWFSGFTFSRTSWESWSIMQSFLFPLPSLIFFPLLYHNLIYVLIIRHHGVNFFPLPLWTVLCSERIVLVMIILKFYLNPCDWWEELLKNIHQCLMMGMGWKAGDTAPLSCTIPQWQGFNLISRRIFTEFPKKRTGPGKHSAYLV